MQSGSQQALRHEFPSIELDPRQILYRAASSHKKLMGNREMKILAFLIFCLASGALADDFRAIDGKEYKNVTVSRVEPDGIVLRTKTGISKIYFVELPKEIQERFHYDAAIASAYSAQQAVNRATTA